MEAGLDPAEAAEMLAGDAYVADVVEDQAMAAQLGANGVPFFVVDRKVGVAGAQPGTCPAVGTRAGLSALTYDRRRRGLETVRRPKHRIPWRT